MAFESRSHHDAVGWVGVETCQGVGPDSDLAVYGYLVQAVFENGPPPRGTYYNSILRFW